MKNIYLYKIDSENLPDFLDEIGVEGKKVIYIHSGGGCCACFTAVLHALNNQKDDVRLVACGNIDSMAFYLFFKFKGEKEILPYATARLHYTGRDYRVMSNGRMEYESDRLYKKASKVDYEREKLFFKNLGLDNKEMGKLERGDEVILSNLRLEELLKKQNGQKH